MVAHIDHKEKKQQHAARKKERTFRSFNHNRGFEWSINIVKQ